MNRKPHGRDKSPDRDALNPRRIAAAVLHRVLDEGAYSHLALDAALAATQGALAPRDRALATELVYGALTWLGRIDAILGLFVRGGLDRVDPDVRAILRAAIYQVDGLDRIPDHAAVDEAVEHARALRCGKALPGFVNGVLRGALRARARWPQPAPPQEGRARHLAERWSMPLWMAERLIDQFGWDDALAQAEAFARRPGLTLRATGALDPAERAAMAAALGGQVTAISPDGLRLPTLTAAAQAAIDEGRALVQDEAAQLVSHLAAPKAGERALDACAGLGGKAAHLAALGGPSLRLTVGDTHAQKLDVLGRRFDLLGLLAPQRAHGDLRDAATLEGPFDLIVLDAPCSGLGVMRRHPEIRWRRQPEEIATLAALQASLLDRAVELLAPGGRLVYSVCTFTPEEGEGQLEAALSRHPGLEIDRPEGGADWGALTRTPLGWLSMPSPQQTDGFYMARARRA